jgi:two-component sensor histidine kinase
VNPAAAGLLQLASLVTFTFGALTFVVLSVLYWRSPKRTRGVFPIFTAVCAGSFGVNLALAALPPDSAAAGALLLPLKLLTGLLPPLIAHLACRRGRSGWRIVLAAFYAVSVALSLFQGLEDAELISTGWGDALDKTPAAMFAIAGILGIAMQAKPGLKRNALQRRHWRSMRFLLALTMLAGAANLVWRNPAVRALPDYLVLTFFCLTLYYQERLVFFDLVMKRGIFFGLGILGLTPVFILARGAQPVILALLAAPFWLAAPWIYARLSRGIDHAWLRRRFSGAEAERKFAGDVHGASTESDLRDRAAKSIGQIFQAPARVEFGETSLRESEPDGGIEARLPSQPGYVALEPRPDCIPYLSDDRGLLQSLAGALALVCENVRFREQEQRLRLLANRAELKALRAQINPHFLFNALNAIAGLIHDQPALADETVEHLAEVFRYTLRKSENEWVRLEEEIEFVTAYLRVEQARFGSRLRVEFDVDPAARAISIPAMTIQPLVENAIKHGIAQLEHAGEVRVRAAIVSGSLCVEIFDNGPGFPEGFTWRESAGAGHGLHNIHERLKGYYGNGAAVRWSHAAGGTRVTLRIPAGGEA